MCAGDRIVMGSAVVCLWCGQPRFGGAYGVDDTRPYHLSGIAAIPAALAMNAASVRWFLVHVRGVGAMGPFVGIQHGLNRGWALGIS